MGPAVCRRPGRDIWVGVKRFDCGSEKGQEMNIAVLQCKKPETIIEHVLYTVHYIHQLVTISYFHVCSSNLSRTVHRENNIKWQVCHKACGSLNNTIVLSCWVWKMKRTLSLRACRLVTSTVSVRREKNSGIRRDRQHNRGFLVKYFGK